MPVPVSRCTEETTSTLSAASDGSGRRPAACVDTSSSTSLSRAETTSPTMSTNVAAPGVRHRNVTDNVASQRWPSSELAQVDGDVVALDLDQRGALARLLLGQAGGRGIGPSWRRR